MLWDKGIKEFVEAARFLKKTYSWVDFFLVGKIDKENPSFIPLKVIMQWNSDGAVRYLGEVDDIRPYICISDVIVLPSYYKEGVPRVLLEAMSMAKPIIATDVPGCREIVQNGINGFMVRPKDVKDLINGMERMLTLSESIRKLMGIRGRKLVVSKFSDNVILPQYVKIIENIFKK